MEGGKKDEGGERKEGKKERLDDRYEEFRIFCIILHEISCLHFYIIKT
jgi:hypothetical protein